MANEPTAISPENPNNNLPAISFEKTSQENIVRKLLEIERRRQELEEQMEDIKDATRAKILAGINGISDNKNNLDNVVAEYKALSNFSKAISYVYR